MVLITEAITLGLLGDDYLIHGIGNEIRVAGEKKFISLPWHLPRKIHGIKTTQDGRILLFGEKYFMLLCFIKEEFSFLCSGKVSDWISGGMLLPGDTFCILTAHSVALKLQYNLDKQNTRIVDKSSCYEKSTLYCAYLCGSTWNDLIVLGGNAFGEIIIWQPSDNLENKCSPVLQRISAHQGVIFSINVNINFNIMTTTSDDRSVRFWTLKSKNNDNKVNWKETQFLMYKSSYGHTARVFQAQIIEECNQPYVVSCGEDYCICLWNSKGELLHKIKQQFGPILEVCYNATYRTIFASTSSGNVIKYGIDKYFNPCYASEVPFLNGSEYLAKIKFIGETTIIGITSQNNLVVKTPISLWKHLKTFSYKCTVFEIFDNFLITAGYKTISLHTFHHESEELEKIFESDVTDGVIRSAFIFSETTYLVCDDRGSCKFSSDKFQTFVTFEIPFSKERWVTSALKIDTFLVLSNRQGNIFLYSLENNLLQFKSILKHIHGYLGVTSMIIQKISPEVHRFKTCGHDGTIKTVEINKITQKMRVVYTENVPVSWVEKLIKTQDGDNYVVGFNDNHFVFWERKYDFLLQAPCGGGHRCWDLHIDVIKNEIKLIYIKNRRLYSLHYALKNESKSKIDLENNFWHVKQCNVLRTIRMSSSTVLLVSGGEDNILKFSKYNFESQKLEVLNQMFLHISSIKAIEILNISKNMFLIFSAGGRAQICVCQFNANDFSIEEKTNYMLKCSDFDRKYQRGAQKIDFDPETRIMDLKILRNCEEIMYIFAGCSDGYIRKFAYQNNTIYLCTQIFYSKCILHLKLLKLLDKDILVSCATNGIVRFWDLNYFLDKSLPIFEHAHHESGINSVDIKYDNTFLYIVTGGDDQNVVFSKVKYLEDSFNVVEIKPMNSLHSAQVNGVQFSSCKQFVYSAGVDQQVCKINLNNFLLEKRLFTCVADAKGLALLNCSNNKRNCLLYGCGLQTIEF